MFDVSFSELMVIAVVALLVIGPEKLPKVARMLGHLTGRVQRYVANVKEDINREMQFEDLQKLQQEIKQGVENSQNSLQNHAQAFEASLSETKDNTMLSSIDTHLTSPLPEAENPKKLVKRPRKPRVAKDPATDMTAATPTLPPTAE